MRQPNIGNRIRPDEKCRTGEIIQPCRFLPQIFDDARTTPPTDAVLRGCLFVIGSMEFADGLCPNTITRPWASVRRGCWVVARPL